MATGNKKPSRSRVGTRPDPVSPEASAIDQNGAGGTLGGESLSFTPLREHRLARKRLQPPLSEVQGVQFSSWYIERVPEILWAVLVASAISRQRRLELFTSVCYAAREVKDTGLFVEHSDLSKANQDQFLTIFRVVLEDEGAQTALRPLLLLGGLPDKEHWEMWISPPDDEAIAWDLLASALKKVVNRRSEESTDIRWTKIMFLALQGKLFLTPAVKHLAEVLVEYPTEGDEASVAAIGSMEMAINTLLAGSTPSTWSSQFWDECFTVTDCVSFVEQETKKGSSVDISGAEFARVYGACASHCMRTMSTTSVDPVHEGTFGMALFATATFAQMFGYMSRRAAGRNLLRTLAETLITLSYLQKEDDQNLWLTWRNYGSGQAKLAFLKMIELTEKPSHVDMNDLEALANEDVWIEFREVNVGSWSGIDLRQMSKEAGVKDVYDSYFVWPSNFVHAQWGAIRDSVYTVCLNPLHRFHRIPRPPRRDLGDIGLDALYLVNKILDLVEKTYPGLSERFEATARDE